MPQAYKITEHNYDVIVVGAIRCALFVAALLRAFAIRIVVPVRVFVLGGFCFCRLRLIHLLPRGAERLHQLIAGGVERGEIIALERLFGLFDRPVETLLGVF